MSSYPNSIPTFPTVTDRVGDVAGTKINAALLNPPMEELYAALVEMGTNPSDVYDDVATRFDALEQAVATGGNWLPRDGSQAMTGDLDLDGSKVIFDLDADSYLHGSADDVVDLVLAGASGEFAININAAEDFKFTANTLTAIAGSTINSDVYKSTTAGNQLLFDPNETGTIVVGSGGGSISGGTYNTLVGLPCGSALTSGDKNTLVGYQAGNALDAESNVTALGYQAALAETTSGNGTYIGFQAGMDANGVAGSVAVGYQAMTENVTGDYNTVVGYGAGKGVAGNSHSYNCFFGYQSGSAITTGTDNTCLGTQSGLALAGGAYNTLVGSKAGDAAQALNGITAVGYQAASAENTSNYGVYVGYQAGMDANGASNCVAVGYQAMYENVNGVGNTVIGTAAGKGVTGNSYGYNCLMGYQAGYSLTTGSYSVAIGYRAMATEDAAGNNVYIGFKSGEDANSAAATVAVGFQAMLEVVGGTGNTIIGYSAGQSVAGAVINYNTCLGYTTGAGLANTAEGNTLIGSTAGDNITTGDYNICLGANADPPSATADYQLNIGNKLYGDLSNGYFGIGITASFSGLLHLDQSASDGAVPCLVVDQADVSEEFIRFIGTSADTVLTQSIVEEGDQAGQTLIGWLKVYVQDDGDQVTDGVYHIPFYTLNA